MSTQRISALARERWMTGAHRGHHLRVHPVVVEWMRLLAPLDRGSVRPWGETQGGFGGVAVVVDDELREGEWRLQPDAERYGTPAEWGLIGNPECEHHKPADITTQADSGARIHRYCPCGAHWFDFEPHGLMPGAVHEPVREPPLTRA